MDIINFMKVKKDEKGVELRKSVRQKNKDTGTSSNNLVNSSSTNQIMQALPGKRGNISSSNYLLQKNQGF